MHGNVKKREIMRARDVKKNWYCTGNNLLRHRSGAVFAACSLESIISLLCYLSARRLHAQEIRDSDLDNKRNRGNNFPTDFFITQNIYNRYI